jgi:hypothetical protein
MSCGESFDKALEGLFGETSEKRAFLAPEEGRAVSLRELLVNEAFEDYLRHLGEKSFQEAPGPWKPGSRPCGGSPNVRGRGLPKKTCNEGEKRREA